MLVKAYRHGVIENQTNVCFPLQRIEVSFLIHGGWDKYSLLGMTVGAFLDVTPSMLSKNICVCGRYDAMAPMHYFLRVFGRVSNNSRRNILTEWILFPYDVKWPLAQTTYLTMQEKLLVYVQSNSNIVLQKNEMLVSDLFASLKANNIHVQRTKLQRFIEKHSASIVPWRSDSIQHANNKCCTYVQNADFQQSDFIGKNTLRFGHKVSSRNLARMKYLQMKQSKKHVLQGITRTPKKITSRCKRKQEWKSLILLECETQHENTQVVSHKNDNKTTNCFDETYFLHDWVLL